MKLINWHGFLAHSDNLPLSLAGIYSIMHCENGKHYIGASNNVERRLQDHSKYRSQYSRISDAISKYGVDAFIVMPLWYALAADLRLNQAETELIDDLDTLVPRGYNVKRSNSPGVYALPIWLQTRRCPSAGESWSDADPLRGADYHRDPGHRCAVLLRRLLRPLPPHPPGAGQVGDQPHRATRRP